jgi:hypothetical protein
MFEYHVHTATNITDMSRILTRHAAEGWRLHSTVYESEMTRFVLVFERKRDDSRGWKGDYHGPG